MNVVIPSWRNRSLTAMRPGEIAALPDKATTPVILTTAAIEQHGPHLPVGMDAMLAQAWLDLALPLLADETPCLVAPPITVGKSNEHAGFPGTLSIEKELLSKLIRSIADQLETWGFRHLLVLNTHGGNIQVVRSCLREIQAETQLHTALLKPTFTPPVNDREQAHGFHAGQVETAWMLALTPEIVDASLANREYPATADSTGELRAEAAPAIFSWITSDLSSSGTIGDATLATSEDGQAWLDAGSRALADSITAFAKWAAAENQTHSN